MDSCPSAARQDKRRRVDRLPPIVDMSGYGLIIWFSCLAVTFSIPGEPRVNTENGAVVGKYATSFEGKLYQSFEGIPYAKPPVGSDRFKPPQRLEKTWLGEWNATSPGSMCLQYSHIERRRSASGQVTYGLIGAEDCLFLNVYTHEGGPTNKDVVVMIHSGAFTFGAGDHKGPEYTMDRDDIVYVTFNYRLGPLGFLTTEDDVIPGNNGLKDQVAALEWVQRNIAAFGGDPNKVTIVGLSAGGSSVHYHFLSPLSDGLFKRGFSYSGTALCPWALVTDGRKRTERLAKYLGCPTTDSKTIAKCLKRRPARKIVEQIKNFQSWLFNPFTVFGPVVEVGAKRPFVDQHPRDLLRLGKVKDLPWFTGATSEDGLYPAADFIADEKLLDELNERWRSIAPDLLFYSEQQPGDISDKVKDSYMGDEKISKETVPQIVKMVGDRLFIAPAVEAAVYQAQHNTQPVYLYMYRHRAQQSLSQFLSGTDTIFGACHGDDFAHVFRFAKKEWRVTESDKAMANLLDDIFITFTKTGGPPESLNWSPVSKDSIGVTYLNIDSPTKVESRTGGDFGNWKNISEIYVSHVSNRDEL